MGTVHKFRRPPKNQKQFRGYRPKLPNGSRSRRWWQWKWLGPLLLVAIAVILGLSGSIGRRASAQTFACSISEVVDGDTLRCGDQRVRLAGIDAPELPGHCRQGRICTPGDPHASTENLRRLVGSGTVKCRQEGTDQYGRIVARCSVGGQDMSCGQIRGGFAVRRYGNIDC